MNLVELGAADLDRCLRHERRNFPSPWSEASVKAELSGDAKHLALGLEQGGFLCAQVFARLVEDELHILNISVEHAYRRKGLATELMSALFERAAALSAESAFLEVRGSNTAAFALYEELGFTRIGLRKSYYADTGEDAVVMYCKLNKARKTLKTPR